MYFTTVRVPLDLTINPPAFQGQTPDVFVQFMASLQGMPLMTGKNGRRYRVKRHGNRAPHKHSLQYGGCGGGINDVRNVWRIYAVGCCVSHHLCALLLACSRLWHWRGLVVGSLMLKMSRRYGSCLALQRELQSLCCICLGGSARHDPYRRNRRTFRNRHRPLRGTNNREENAPAAIFRDRRMLLYV